MKLVQTENIKNAAIKIILNDPDNLNAMSDQMAQEFAGIVQDIRKQERDIRAVVLCGAGRAFSAGGDLAMLERKSTLNPEENRKLMLQFYHSFLSILQLNVPIIAAINGHAIGAGLCLASACDIRICSESAKLGFTFVKLGLHPGMGATFFLPRILGDARARELMFSGRIISAGEAQAIGLVSKVVASDKLAEEYESMIAEIASSGPQAVSLLCQILRGHNEKDLHSALEREASCQSQSYASSEFKEGVRATIEKRKASFVLTQKS